MFDLLLLVTEIDSVLLLPTWMLPKLRPEEARVSCPDAALEYKRILRRTSFHQAFLHSKPTLNNSPVSLRDCLEASCMGSHTSGAPKISERKKARVQQGLRGCSVFTEGCW